MTIHITVAEIKQIFELLLKRINDDKIEMVDIETDFYWLVMSGVILIMSQKQ
jgi:hypothetical protein